MQRPPVMRQAQRPPVQVPEQQSVLRVHIASVGRQGTGSPHVPPTQRYGGQQSSRSSLSVHVPPRGMHVGGGVQRPIWQVLGEQQSALVVHIPPVGRHGGEQRPSVQVLGAQQSPSVVHAAPTAGQGCQMRYETTTSSPMFGR